MKRITLSAALLLMSCMALADSGAIAQATGLHRAPDGAVIAQLPENALIEVLQRQGGWYQIKTSDGRQGYVPLRAVRLGEEKAEESVFGGLWSWLNSSRRSQDQMSTATAGVRGFDEEDLQASKPDYDALNTLTGWAVGADSARAYASKLPLSARNISELDDK